MGEAEEQFNSVEQKPKIGIWILTIVIVGVLVVGGYYWLSSEQLKEYTGSIDNITLAVATMESTTLVRVALEKGYFEEQGLNIIKTTEHGVGKLALLEVLGGRADIATASETPVVEASFDREDFKIFATMHESSTNVKLIALKDHGIISAQDLEGKKIATTVGTVGHFFLYLFLLHAGIRIEDIELIDVEPLALVEMLQAGEIDAFSIREPYVFRAKKLLGDEAVVFIRDDIYIATFNMIASSEFIENNPEIIVRFLRALLKAEKFVEDSREESVSIVSMALQVDKNYLDSTWEESEFTLSLSQGLLITMEDQARGLIKNNLTDAIKVPNYLDYIYVDALEKIKPEGVSIIR